MRETLRKDTPRDAYRKGCLAFLDKVVVGDNPYEEDDEDRFWAWMKGWGDAAAARRKDLEKDRWT